LVSQFIGAQHTASSQYNALRRRWQTGTQEFIKAAYRRSYQVLTSPIDGVVQQLAINTVAKAELKNEFCSQTN